MTIKRISTHPIERIIPINLKRRQDKLIAYHGAMQAYDVPVDVIKPFGAYDAEGYDSVYEIREAASKMFPFWGNLTDAWLDDGWLGKGSLCCLWSMQSVLKQIAESKLGLSIMMTDNYYLRKVWNDLHKALDQVGEFDIFQLHHWSNCDGEYPTQYVNYLVPYADYFPTPLPHYPSISAGLAGAGDSVLILSPYGAEQILHWSSQEPSDLIETVLYKQAMKSDKPMTGCLSPVKPWLWSDGTISLEFITGRPDSERQRW